MKLWAGIFFAVMLGACSSGGGSSGGNTGSGSNSSSSSSSSSGSAVGDGTSDEFSGVSIDLLADNTSAWQVLHPEMADAIDMGVTVNDALTMLALSTEPAAVNASWFEDNFGALVYQNVTGNFAVMIKLRVVDRNDPDLSDAGNLNQAPDGDFNAGGFVIRDPAGSHNNDENWVMYNMGGQGSTGYAREMKKTLDSVSNLFLTSQTTLEEFLLACGIGDAFYFYHWDETEAAWRQETFYNGVDVHGVQVVTDNPTGMGIISEFSMPGMGMSAAMYFELDLPDTVQVGLMGGAWTSPYETRAEFDYVRFADTAPSSQAGCTSGFPSPM